VLLRLALAATVAIGLAQATDTQSRTIPLPGARRLTLEATVGNVRILGAPRSDARLEIVRKAPSRDGLTRIPIVIDETADETRISVAQLEGRTEP
jgi:hypothetical protein